MAARDRGQERQVAEAFGARVRALRLEQGMTQERLAEAAGFHPTFISNIERGYRVASIVTLLRLAAGLGIDGARLVEGLRATP